MRAGIENNEFILQMVGRTEDGSRVSRIEHIRIRTIRNQFHPPGAELGDMRHITGAVDHHPVSVGVQEALQPERHFDQERVFQHADGNGELRPQVTYFEEERHPLQARQQPGSHALEDGWRGAPDQVHILYAQPGKKEEAMKETNENTRWTKDLCKAW